MAFKKRNDDRPKPEARTEQQISTIVLRAQNDFTTLAAEDKSLIWLKEAGFAKQMIAKSYKLASADEQSLVDAVTNVASVGLSLNPVEGFAIIVPRWDKHAGKNFASLMIPYKGLLKLATDVGLDEFVVENVYAMDTFRMWADDDGPHVHYECNFSFRKQKDTADNPYIGTFVRAKFKEYAGTFIEFVDDDEMIKIRAQSDGYDPNEPGCVWIKWAGEQRKKAALKRAQKRWPKTSSKAWQRLNTAIAIDNQFEGARMREKEREDATEGEIIEKITPEQVTKIVALCYESGVSPYRLGLAYKLKADNAGKGLEDLTSDKFDEVIERLNNALKEKKAREEKDQKPKDQKPDDRREEDGPGPDEDR